MAKVSPFAEQEKKVGAVFAERFPEGRALGAEVVSLPFISAAGS